MPRWLWFAPLVGLVVALGLMFYRQGLIVAQLTETDVIEMYTAHYLETHGGPVRATDCVARPGAQTSVWIVVSCTSADGTRFDFPVDRMGRLLRLEPTEEAPDAPQT
jgi:hypothetical protein